MKRMLLTIGVAVLALGLTVQDAEARRLGGGMSRGMQRDSVTQRQAAPSRPAAPAQQQAAPQQNASTPAPMAQPQKRNWLGPLAGLAAGIGLGALFSHLGLGAGLGNLLTIVLLALAAFFVFRLIFRRSVSPSAAQEPLRYAGASGPAMAPLPEGRFDAPTGAGSSVAAASSPVLDRSVPADFDQESFLRIAKVNFLRLQAANDAGNLEDIREFTTPEMFAEIKLDLNERHGSGQQTDVVTLEAELLEVVTESDRHVASVRFHGMIREEKDGPAASFNEVWNLVKPVDGSRGWLVAGIQQLN